MFRSQLSILFCLFFFYLILIVILRKEPGALHGISKCSLYYWVTSQSPKKGLPKKSLGIYLLCTRAVQALEESCQGEDLLTGVHWHHSSYPRLRKHLDGGGVMVTKHYQGRWRRMSYQARQWSVMELKLDLLGFGILVEYSNQHQQEENYSEMWPRGIRLHIPGQSTRKDRLKEEKGFICSCTDSKFQTIPMCSAREQKEELKMMWFMKTKAQNEAAVLS